MENRTDGVPPPVPRMGGADGVRQRGNKGCRMALLIGGLVILAGLLIVGAIVGIGLLFEFTSKDYLLSDEQRAAIHTVAEVVERTGGEFDEELELWTASRLIDGSVSVSYEYEVPEGREGELEEVYVSVELSREQTVGDAVAIYHGMWQAFRTAYGMGGGELSVEEQSDLVDWGDVSSFGYLNSGGERYGMVFCGRKGKLVYLFVCSGLVLEGEQELDDFFRGKLDAVAALEW